jgi:hypothetical protein
MKPIILLSLLFLFIYFNTVAQKNALESITENDLKAHLEFIASDYMQGRDFGTQIPGLEITADYLKTQLIKTGLNTVNESYFQKVEMVRVKSDTNNVSIVINRNDGSEFIRSDGLIDGINTSENETLEGEIVFAGYGFVDKITGYNDLEGLELKDKIVLMMTRNQKAVVDSLSPNLQNELEFSKYDTIFKLGAKAIITCMDPIIQDKTLYNRVKHSVGKGYVLLDIETIKFFPGTILIASNSLVDNILKEYNTTLEQLQKKLNQSGEPQSFPLEGIKANIDLPKKVETIIGKNVIGIIEGSDPILKNECVVLSAHYDHLGMNADGEVFNGADDNGSGTVALLEIAEAFTKMKKTPKRSIVFAWVTAEEKGLFGSEYYSQHPVFPLEKTVANINLDMIGRVSSKDTVDNWSVFNSLADENGIYIISGKQSSELTQLSNKTCKDLNLIPSDSLTDAILHRSDYYNFYKNGIPILGVTTGLHEDYHKVSDEPDKIDYHKMKRVTVFAFLVANKIANQKKRIVIDNPVSQEK